MKPTDYQWLTPQAVEVPQEIRDAVGGHPLLAETLVRRGITTLEAVQVFLYPEKYTPAPSEDLPDLEKAVVRIEQAICRHEKICIWGDFDVDGQTSTAILTAGLRKLGGEVIFHIPVRAKESHGVNIENLQQIIDQGSQLIVTCDTGVSAHEAADYARSRKIDLIITDHHTLPPELPDAFAVVNSQRLPPEHPLNPLCGVGVAYKVIESLFKRAGLAEESREFLDLAALGTVADLAVLRGENRYIVQSGLIRMRTQPRLSIQTLLDKAGVNYQNLSEEHISFEIGPRLNSIGRLGDSNPMVEFLLTEDKQTAEVWAANLEGLNNKRKLDSDLVFQAALSQIEQDPSMLQDPVLVLSQESWPGGIVGIVASRIVERYHRPTILITTQGENHVGRGSARSINGINITEVIAHNQNLLLGFGGHPMAAGLSIEEEKIPAFRKALTKTMQEMTVGKATEIELTIDAFLSLKDISLELISDLEKLAPFGPGNPPLTFATQSLTLVSKSLIGKSNEHLKIIIRDSEDIEKSVIWWRGAEYILPEAKFDLAYTLRASDYQGQPQVTIEWKAAREIEQSAVKLARNPFRKPTVHDFRKATDPIRLLHEIFPSSQPFILAEGESELDFKVHNHCQLSPSPNLVIWTLPPGKPELMQILESIDPLEIYLLCQPPSVQDIKTFFDKIVALSSAAIENAEGWLNIPQAAVQTAQREATVRAALNLLETMGKIRIISEIEASVQITRNTPIQINRENVALAQQKLSDLFKETHLFRKYFQEANSPMDTFLSKPLKKIKE